MWFVWRTVTDGRDRVTTSVALALGSNIGDRMAHLHRAVEALEDVGNRQAVSSVYETPPAGYRDQPDFLNLVMLIGTFLAPEELLAVSQSVEREAGRRRSFRDAPRTLDIDIILYGTEVVDRPGLSIPHPRWRERSFVAIPLMEVAPDWRDPVAGRTVAEVARAGFPEPVEIRRAAPPPGEAGNMMPESEK